MDESMRCPPPRGRLLGVTKARTQKTIYRLCECRETAFDFKAVRGAVGYNYVFACRNCGNYYAQAKGVK